MRRLFSILIVSITTLSATAGESPKLKWYGEFDPTTRQLVEKVSAGFGDGDAIAKIRVTRRVATTVQKGAANDKPERVAIASISEYPSHHLVQVRAANGTMTLGINEKTSYLIPTPEKQQVKGAAIKLTPEERADLIHYFSADPLFVVKMLHDTNYKFAAGPKTKVGDRECQVLHASVEGLDIDWTVDLETGRLLRSEAAGELSEFSDWQQVGKVSVPFQVRTTRGGSLFSETKLAKYEIDPVIDSRATFRAPDLWLTRWKVPPARNYYGGYQTVYVFLYWLD